MDRPKHISSDEIRQAANCRWTFQRLIAKSAMVRQIKQGNFAAIRGTFSSFRETMPAGHPPAGMEVGVRCFEAGFVGVKLAGLAEAGKRRRERIF
jgi:hypothetical protein